MNRRGVLIGGVAGLALSASFAQALGITLSQPLLRADRVVE